MDREPIQAVPSRSAYLTDADVTVRVQAERPRHYRPQIEAYREVIRERYGIEGEAVRGTLVCLAGGRVVGVG
jgi:hypothetical protein